MKKVLLVVVEMVLFLVVFFVGSLLPTLGVLPMVSVPAGVDHIFVVDGLLLMLALYGLMLLIGVARRRIVVAWQNPTIAVVLALVLGLAAKFGFKGV